MPFHSVSFHLLSQCEIDEALNEAENARRSPPPGMSEVDVNYWVKRIQIAAAFIAISVGKEELAKGLFETAQCKWIDILLTFANAGFIETLGPMPADMEPIAEDKYVRRCDADSVRSFICRSSLGQLEQTGCAESARIWLDLLIKYETPRVIFDAISQISLLGIDLNWRQFIQKIESLSESNRITVEVSNAPVSLYPINANSLATMSWFVDDIDSAINHWVALCRGELKDDSFLGIDCFAPLILQKSENPNVVDKVVAVLDDLIVASVEWTIKILSEIKGTGTFRSYS